MDDLFLKNPDEYKRDLDIIRNANQLAARYLHLKTQKPYKDCLAFVEKQISDQGQFPLKPKVVKILKRNKVGDREKATIPIDKLLKVVTKNKSILTPNMVSYTSSDIEVSSTAEYVEEKIASRAPVKKRGLTAFQMKDMVTFLICSNREYGIKLLNNSISGARASPHNPLFLKTAHSSLTSNCRVAVSYSNATTEKFLSGNRHYYTKDIVIQNILTIITISNLGEIEQLINYYNLHIPTLEETSEVIFRATQFYWINERWKKEIIDLLLKLSDIERAAFVYIGDFYHLAKFNDALVRGIIAEAIARPATKIVDDPDIVVKNANSDIIALVGILCSDLLAGTTPALLKEKSPEGYQLYADTIFTVNRVGLKYHGLIKGLFTTENMPSSINEFPHSIRRVVVGSDTDSTMFTTQDWVVWYFGKLIFSHEAYKVTNFLCYLTSGSIAHMLASTCKQLGVSNKNLFKLKMKNEYSFLVFMRANAAKHYATLSSSREGNVYEIPKIEIKGVRLKDSKVPKLVMQRLEDEIINTMVNITENKGVQIYAILQRCANIEHDIKQSLERGEIKYLSTVNITQVAAKLIHHDLWVNVYERKYGIIETPPYRAVKISTILLKPNILTKWVNTLDLTIQESMKEWLLKAKRKDLKTLYLPYELFEGGLPQEFIDIIDVRKIIAQLMAGVYIFLEMLGFYIKNKNHNILLYDEIIQRPEYGLLGDSENEKIN